MKKLFNNRYIVISLVGSILLSFILIMPSCDEVNESEYVIPIPMPKLSKRILLEDYTGHLCVNCPKATAVANLLKDKYKDSIIVVGIHTGIYARPTNSGDFTADYRTDAGAKYDAAFSVGALVGYPGGLISRSPFRGNLPIRDLDWETAVAQIFAQQPAIKLNLDIENAWNESEQSFDTSIEITALDDFSEELMLQVWLVEDSIQSPQLSAEVIKDYWHRHVLRATVNDTWGEPLNNAAKGEVITKEYTQKLDPENKGIRPKYCSIVSFVYRKSNREVLQVNEHKIIK